MANDEHATPIERLVQTLEDGSKVPAKRRTVGLRSTVDDLAAAAYENGLLPAELTQLIGLISTPSHLDQASLAAIVRNLYPAAQVSDEDVLKVLGCLGHGRLKPSLTVQSHFLRWLILVYHVIENPGILSQAYSVLFNLLDTAALRAQLCHVLALITRRKHVQPFRIQALMALSRQTGSDPSVLGLLRVFKNYYPEIIVGDVTKGRASAFKHPDPQWRERLDAIQDAHARHDEGRQAVGRSGFRVKNSIGSRRTGRTSAIPAVHTLHAKEDSVTLEEVDSAEQFVQNLEKFELPSQLIAVLADPLLQKLMLLRPAEEAQARVDSWMSACAEDMASGEATDGDLMDVMEAVRDYAVSSKSLSPSVLLVLRETMNRWNGREKQDVVLEALSFLPLKDFDAELYPATLGPLERKVLDSSPASQLALLSFYTALLQHWTTKFTSEDTASSQAASALQGLANHVNRLCLAVLQTSPSAASQLRMLDLYEQMAALLSHPAVAGQLPVVNPPSALVYTLLFSPSVAVVSRLCGVLTKYKLAWQGAMGRPGRPLSHAERARVNAFNGFLMDVCNCLWRGRAFTLADPNALGCSLPRPVVDALGAYLAGVDAELTLASAFALSYSPSLCLQSIAFVRGLEDATLEEMGDEPGDGASLQRRHAGPVTQSSLTALGANGGLVLSWQEYRSGVLVHLEEQHIVGIPALMRNTMKHLMGPGV